jgi:hypothetical protein
MEYSSPLLHIGFNPLFSFLDHYRRNRLNLQSRGLLLQLQATCESIPLLFRGFLKINFTGTLEWVTILSVLFICALFNDAVSRSAYTASSRTMTSI